MMNWNYSRILRQLVRQTRDDDVPLLASALAYRFFLALFPFLIFLTWLGTLLASAFGIQNPTRFVLDLFGQAVPASIADGVQQEVERTIQSRNVGLVSLGAVAALFFATTGTNALIKAMNRAYDVEETRPLWKRLLMAVGVTLVAALTTTFAFVLFLGGQVFGQEIAEALGVSGLFWTVLSFARWPVAFLLLVLGVGLMYYYLPNLHLKLPWILPGTILFGVGWLAATYGLGLYVSRIGAYGATYGALAGVVVVLVWFYLTAFVMLIGAELNQIVDERVDPDTIQEQRRRSRDVAGRQGRSTGRAA